MAPTPRSKNTAPWPDRLCEARRRTGMTQETIGNLAGKTKNSISQYERGSRKPDPTILKIYATHCGVSADYLLGVIDQPLAPVANAPIDLSALDPNHAPTGELLVVRMEGDAMSAMRVQDNDLLTLSTARAPRSGDLVLVRQKRGYAIMLYLENARGHLLIPDTRNMDVLEPDACKILAVVIQVAFSR
jgi:transcriptional regulator with XRE-family HTH domain